MWYMTLLKTQSSLTTSQSDKVVAMMKVYLLVALLLFFNSSKCFAWGPLAHYSINRELSNLSPDFAPDKACMNLPDVWLNRDGVRITKAFAWSHSVQTTGGTLLYPNTPVYPEDGRNPGHDMLILSKKLTNSSALSRQTAFGFIGHNALDRNVHYDYFEGSTRYGTDWVNNHYWKEDWADYFIFLTNAGGDFDIMGRATSFFGEDIDHDSDWQTFIPCNADPNVIIMAQKAFVKNRRFTDTAHVEKFNDIDSVTSFNQKLAVKVAEINNHIRGMNYGWFTFLRGLEMANDWNVGDIAANYNTSKDIATARLKAASGL